MKTMIGEDYFAYKLFVTGRSDLSFEYFKELQYCWTLTDNAEPSHRIKDHCRLKDCFWFLLLYLSCLKISIRNIKSSFYITKNQVFRIRVITQEWVESKKSLPMKDKSYLEMYTSACDLSWRTLFLGNQTPRVSKRFRKAFVYFVIKNSFKKRHNIKNMRGRTEFI